MSVVTNLDGTTVTTVTTITDASFMSDMIDGASGVVMLKEEVILDTFGKRVGALIPGVILGSFATGKFIVKPALDKLPKAQADAVRSSAFMGKILL